MSAITKKPTVPQFINLEGNKIIVSKRFVYEVTKYLYIDNRAEYVAGRIFESNKYLKDKCELKYFPDKKHKQYVVEVSLTMLSAPLDYINNNNLKEYA